MPLLELPKQNASFKSMVQIVKISSACTFFKCKCTKFFMENPGAVYFFSASKVQNFWRVSRVIIKKALITLHINFSYA